MLSLLRVAVVLELAVSCVDAMCPAEQLAANASGLATTLSRAVGEVDIPGEACTDIDSNGISARSSLGGFCCKFCKEGRKTFICCPSKDYVSDGGRDVTLKLENNDYNRANMCCGQIEGDYCGATPGGAIVIDHVSQSADNKVNLKITNITAYSPVMPRIISGHSLDADREGWMGNGKKVLNSLSDDLIQINQCNDKVFTARACFEDSEHKPVLMKSARFRVFDIDMGPNPTRYGPEAVQFRCPGGTFELYGDTPPYVSRTAGKPIEVKEKAAYNGLTKHTYSCPAEELVTVWASMESLSATDGVPKSAAPAELSVPQQERMIMISYRDVQCVDLTYAAMPPRYRQMRGGSKDDGNFSHGWDINLDASHGGNPLNGSAPISYQRFDDLEPGHCGGGEYGQTRFSRPGQFGGGGRNIQLSGYVDPNDEPQCTKQPRECKKKVPPPPQPEPEPEPEPEPPISPARVTVHGDPMFKKNGVGLQFSIPLGRPTELLSWPGKAGEKLRLYGTTFERQETGHQWFNSFAMTVDDKEVFNVSTGKVERGTLKLLADGNVIVPSDVTSLSSAVHPGTTLELATMMGKKFKIGHKVAQTLKVLTGDTTFSVYSSKAAKFAYKGNQFKFRHLNVRLDSGLPTGATGTFAEMAGSVPMRPETRALLHKPKLFDKLVREERQQERLQADRPKASRARASKHAVKRKGVSRGRDRRLSPSRANAFETGGEEED
jgi:hypothetical protein